jgi:16S rRNA (adenine1518-N6/adenine1519-N6)-dimethyltransferase
VNPVRPRKRLGQHFLRDGNVVQRIVSAVQPSEGDALVEIGPGLGAITRLLLSRAGRLEAVEIDPRVVPELEKRCAGLGELVIHREDVLRVDLRDLCEGRELRLVGNLPYNVSSPILFHLLGQIDRIKDAHFMLQREVAERLAAFPGGRDYGRLTVMVQYWCEVQLLLRISPSAFRPPPKVESAVVRLLPRRPPQPTAADPESLDRVVRAAFGQRRKQLANALKGMLQHDAIVACEVDPAARAETLAVADFVRLADALAAQLEPEVIEPKRQPE